jgi:hypothetical protein
MKRLNAVWLIVLLILPVCIGGCGLAGVGSTAGGVYAVMTLLEEDEEEEPPEEAETIPASVTPTGPLGGHVTALACDASGATPILYAGTFRAGVFKSVDSGTTWAVSSTGLNRNLSVTDVVIDAGAATQIYASTGKPYAGGVYLSTDSGANWAEENEGLGHVDVRCLASPAAGTLYAGTGGAGVFIGTVAAGEITWIAAASTGMTNLTVTDIVVSGTNVFAATAGGGVFHHDDTGSPAPASWTWTPVNASLTDYGINALAVLGTDLWAGTDSSSAFSLDFSAGLPSTWVWTALTALTDPDVTALAVDPQNASNLFAATATALYSSTNGGTTWGTPTVPPADGSIACLIFESATSTAMYAGGYSGGFYSTPDGDTWSVSNSGLVAGDFMAMAVDPGSSGSTSALCGAWIRTGRGSATGAHRTQDSGSTWNPVSSGAMTAEDVRVLLVDPASSDTAYAATWGGGVLKTTNATAVTPVWASSNTGLGSNNVSALALDAAASSNLYAGTDLGIYRSTDGANIWTSATTQPPPGRATLTLTGVTGVFQNGEIVTGGTSTATGTVRSGGGTLTLVVDMTSGQFQAAEAITGGTSSAAGTVSTEVHTWFITSLIVDPGTTTTVWCTMNGPRGGLYLSTDSGATWAALAVQPASTELTCIVRDGASATTYYVGSSLSGIFRTVDSGGSWTNVSNQVGTVEIVDLIADDRSAGSGTYYILAATSRGIFRTEDRGDKWLHIIDDNPVNSDRAELKSALRLGLDPLTGNENVLWVATGGRGILRIVIP